MEYKLKKLLYFQCKPGQGGELFKHKIKEFMS